MIVILMICALMVLQYEGSPLKSPTYVSPWYRMTSRRSGLYRIDVEHGIGEMPIFVQVQVKSVDEPNKDFIFPASGHIFRDDDDGAAPYSGIVYLYNEQKVTVSAPVRNNHYDGRTIYTENSEYWMGPNAQDTFVTDVRVRVWRADSFPKPDYHSTGDPIGANCDSNPSAKCFYEKQHNFDEYPSLLVVRTKLKGENQPFTGFMADAAGASHIVYKNNDATRNGYVIYGFNESAVRIWTDSSNAGEIFHNDGYAFKSVHYAGDLEIMAWRQSSLSPDLEHTAELGAIPGTYFEMETSYQSPYSQATDDIVAITWVEALDGENAGFRFVGTGSMAYTNAKSNWPCHVYGGLIYSYTNTTLRLWKPGTVSNGKLVCIADMFGGGLYTQASDNGRAVMNIWTVSSIGEECHNNTDCIADFSVCVNSTCTCQEGYFQSLAQCRKELTCADEVPNILELERRQRNNFVETGQHPDEYIDDSFIEESWYRAENSEGQFLMPDSGTKPSEGQCGTLNPAFIKGLHPVLEDLGENGTEIDITNLSNASYSIKIRKCQTSIQYRLKAIVQDSFAFCFDSPNIQGQLDFDEAPTDMDIGRLSVEPDLQFFTELNYDGREVYNPLLVFACKAEDYNSLPENLLYTTYWFIDGNLLLAHGPANNVSILTEHELLQHGVSLGFEVRCGIQLSTSVTGYKTPLVQSETFFAGIKFTESRIVIPKGGEAILEFTTTVPLGCRYTNRTYTTNCSKLIHMKSPDKEHCESSDILFLSSTQKCGVSMKAFTESELWGPRTYEFKITTEDVNYNDKYFFRLQLVTDRLGHRIWNEYEPEDITVHVSYSDSTKYKLCYSRVDPHMRTSDGYPYEHQYKGSFILYRNFKHGIELQMKTKICNNGRAYCACAVAARAGGDVFLINLCGRSKFIGYTSCTDNGILAVKKKSEKRYQVYTPIGTYVDIRLIPHPAYYDLMNIDIYMAPKDFNATEGLCGYYDGDRTNDLRKRGSDEFYKLSTQRRHYHPTFSNEWRIQSNETNYLIPNIDPLPPQWDHSLFCTCNYATEEDVHPESVCSPSMHLNCSVQDNTIIEDCLTYNYDSKDKHEIQRRSVLTLDSEITKETEENRRQKRDIPEEEAEDICRRVITNHPTISELKHRLIGIDIENAIQECAFDVSEENDESWADIYPDSLIQIIETFNEKEPKYVEENAEEISKFKTMACPRNCSGNGVCNDRSTCDCHEGYHASDCSVDISVPLYIDDIYGDGLCDINGNRPCECFTVQTIDLLDGFQCEIAEKQVYSDETEHEFNAIVTGEYKDIFNGICCIETRTRRRRSDSKHVFTRIYNISISNDGINFGEHRTMMVYNSNCQKIETDGVYLKDHTCFIEGMCLQENMTSSTDSCLSCLPIINGFEWTNVCGKEDQSWTSILTLISVISGTAVAVLVFLLFLVFTRCLCRPRKQVESLNAEIPNTELSTQCESKQNPPPHFVFGLHK